MDIHAIMQIVITMENRDATICQAGTSVTSNLHGMENGAENGIMDATTDTFPFGDKSAKYAK